MATIKSQLPAQYSNAATRPADCTQTMIDLFNLTGYIDSTLPNFTLVEDSLTAHAGGGQASALALSSTVFSHRVTTVASGADSVKLPAALAGGQPHFVMNSAAANSMQVFGTGTDTINDVAAGTGVAQAAGIGALYFPLANGKWYRVQGS